ncbi:MAG: adenylate kinase family protein [Candidatus Methanomethylophilaceae archaeon]|jgi:adenylate kinase
MLTAVTGTPGTGKTELGKKLSESGRNVIFLNDFIKENNLLDEYDEVADSYDVDTDELNLALKEYQNDDVLYYVEGHLSHFVKSSKIIVMRCNPEVLAGRLKKRNYSEEKIRENVQAEILDVILCESVSSDISVYELDSTSQPVGELVESVIKIENNQGDYRPGKVDWTGSMEEWF